MKKTIISVVASLGLVLAGASSAVAGEVNGRGDKVPGAFNASSACAFSGLDTLDDSEEQPPEFNDDDVAIRGNQSPGGKDRYHGVQNYGTYVRAGLKDVIPMSPGQDCRGNATDDH